VAVSAPGTVDEATGSQLRGASAVSSLPATQMGLFLDAQISFVALSLPALRFSDVTHSVSPSLFAMQRVVFKLFA
jgi:hypothetical protein